MPVQLIEAICKLLNCEPIALAEILNHPSASIRLQDYLHNKQIRTNYMNRDEHKKEVKFSRFSIKNASTQHAYEGYLNVTVCIRVVLFRFSTMNPIHLDKSPLLLQTPN